MTHTDIEKALAFATNPATALQTSALEAASPIVLALAECDEELRADAIELFKQLNSGELGRGATPRDDCAFRRDSVPQCGR